VLVVLVLRNRTGDAGSSRLTDTQTPIEVRTTVGEGRAAVRVTPRKSELRVQSLLEPTEHSQYGRGPLATGSVNTSQLSGLGLSAGYEGR
jgi:hypothetical protein